MSGPESGPEYSQEFVFPSFGQSSGELFGLNSYQNLFVCVYVTARSVQKILGKSSDYSLLLEDFFGPLKVNFRV